MDTVKRHIERLKVAIERHERAVGLASAEFRSGIGAIEKEYERRCVIVARRVLGAEQSMSVANGKKGDLALMSAANGRPEYDVAKHSASARFDAEMLKLDLARDDAIAAADKAFLLEEEEIHRAINEDDKPQPPQAAA